jgi:hypothetical protein
MHREMTLQTQRFLSAAKPSAKLTSLHPVVADFHIGPLDRASCDPKSRLFLSRTSYTLGKRLSLSETSSGW